MVAGDLLGIQWYKTKLGVKKKERKRERETSLMMAMRRSRWVEHKRQEKIHHDHHISNKIMKKRERERGKATIHGCL